MNRENRRIWQAANYNAKMVDNPHGFGYNNMGFEYMQNWSLGREIKIIVKTLLTVALRKGTV